MLMNNKLLTIRAENVIRILPPLNVKKRNQIGSKIINKVCSEYKINEKIFYILKIYQKRI